MLSVTAKRQSRNTGGSSSTERQREFALEFFPFDPVGLVSMELRRMDRAINSNMFLDYVTDKFLDVGQHSSSL